MSDLYEILGVSRDASAAVIKAAYKRAAMKHHPDREDGDKVAFQAIQHAYDVLSDRERRTHYDATGSAERALTPEEQAEKTLRVNALQLIRGAIIQTLVKVDETKVDVLAGARDLLGAALKDSQESLKTQTERKEKAERAARRVVSDEDTLVGLLASLSAEMDSAIASTRQEIAQLDLALAILESAKYTVDIPTEEDLERQYREQVAGIANRVFAQHFGPGTSFFGSKP